MNSNPEMRYESMEFVLEFTSARKLLGGSADAWPPRAVKRWERADRPLDERPLVGLRRRGRVRHHRPLGQELLHGALPDASAPRDVPGVRRRALRRDAERRGGVRMGFDHVGIAAGAGKPTIIDVKNNLIRGVRKASDFLMALQLGSVQEGFAGEPAGAVAGHRHRRRPDRHRHHDRGRRPTTQSRSRSSSTAGRRWSRAGGEGDLVKLYDPEEAVIAREFLEHGRAVRAERARAAAAGEQPDFAPLIVKWGGVSLVYRKSMADSPAYRLNHEEITKFFEEGVRFVEQLSPVACIPDEHGALKAVEFERVDQKDADHVTLPARSLFVAAGTSPNVTYERERPGSFEIDPRPRPSRANAPSAGGRNHRAGGGRTRADRLFHQLPARRADGQLLRRQPPDLRGLGGARDGVGEGRRAARRGAVRARHRRAGPGGPARARRRLAGLRDQAGRRLARRGRARRSADADHRRGGREGARRPRGTSSPDSSSACRTSRRSRRRPTGTRLVMEGLALTGRLGRQGRRAAVADRAGDGRQLAPGHDACSRASRWWSWGRPARPPRIPAGESVLLAAAAWATPCCSRSRGRCARPAAGCCTSPAIAAATTSTRSTRSRRRPIRSSGASTAARPITPRRPQDRAFVGNIVQAMGAYARGELGEDAGAAAQLRSRDRHRQRPHDGGRQAGAARRAGAVLPQGARRHRVDQLAHAVHDERDLRAVPAEATWTR